MSQIILETGQVWVGKDHKPLYIIRVTGEQLFYNFSNSDKEWETSYGAMKQYLSYSDYTLATELTKALL